MSFGICPRMSRMPKSWHTYVITYSNFMVIVEPSLSLKLCKCSQIPQSSPRVTSTFNRNALSFWTPKATQEILRLTSLPHSHDQHQKQKGQTLDPSSIFIKFSYTRNKKKNPSPWKKRLPCLTTGSCP